MIKLLILSGDGDGGRPALQHGVDYINPGQEDQAVSCSVMNLRSENNKI